MVSFSKLKELRISGCHAISFVISGNMVQKLHNLEELWVGDCGLVNEIIQLLDDESTIDEIDFNKLKRLHLCDLPNLKGFCSASCTFRFSSLEDLHMLQCPKMEFLCKGDLHINNNALKECIYMDFYTHIHKAIHETSTGTDEVFSQLVSTKLPLFHLGSYSYPIY